MKLDEPCNQGHKCAVYVGNIGYHLQCPKIYGKIVTIKLPRNGLSFAQTLCCIKSGILL